MLVCKWVRLSYSIHLLSYCPQFFFFSYQFDIHSISPFQICAYVHNFISKCQPIEWEKMNGIFLRRVFVLESVRYALFIYYYIWFDVSKCLHVSLCVSALLMKWTRTATAECITNKKKKYNERQQRKNQHVIQ